jgi:hypothetical protein
MRWQDLPPEVLIKVFKLLPNNYKLQAGLVCRLWQPPADAACEDITLLGGKADRLQVLIQRWGPRRGNAVHSLCLQLQREQSICQWLQPATVQLPSRLVSLQLLGGTFKALPLPVTAPSCLTKLVLQQQTLEVPAASAPAPEQLLLHKLRELNSLQHLSISLRPKQWLLGAAIGGAAGGSSSTIGLFPVLEAIAGSGKHLTFLELQGMRHLQPLPQQPAPQQQGVLHLGGQDGAPEQQQQQEQYLAQFTNLQELILQLPDSRCLGGIEQIHSLTKLSLIAHNELASVYFSSQLLSPGDSSSIGRLTNLRSLSFQGGRCSAGAVSNITSLTSLTLNWTQWDAALWGWLERLPLLVSLSFAAMVAGGGEGAAMDMVAGGDEAAAGYAALTASSSLQQLDLSCLPRGVWQHLFLAGRQLQQLHTLCLPSGITPLQADDVQALMRCCGSALRHLDGGQVLPFTPALTSLTQLTYLAVVQARRAADAAHLGSMTHLQRYKVTNDSQHKLKWRCCDIQPLKKLSLLTSLELAGGTLSSPALSDADSIHYLYELGGLAELTVPALTEQQLLRLAEKMRGLTSLSFSTSELGTLLIDRLALLDPHSFDLQERALDPLIVNSNAQPSRRLRAGIDRIAIISKVCSSSVTQIRFGLGHAGQWEALHMNRDARMHDAHSKDRPAGAQCCMGC